MKMKTKLILSFIAAMLLQFTTMKADTYTDGLTKLINSEVLAAFNEKSFQAATQIPGANANYTISELKNDAIEWLAPYYRKTMSEKEFNEMVAYYMQPDIMAIQKKILASASGDRETMMQQLMPQMQSLMMGGDTEEIKMPECDPELKKEIIHWLEINKTAEYSKATFGSAKQMIGKMTPDNIPAEQKEMIVNMVGRLFSFLEKNITPLTATMMINGKVDLKDLQTLNAIEKKPFFANYQKTNSSIAKDMSSFMNIMIEKMYK